MALALRRGQTLAAVRLDKQLPHGFRVALSEILLSWQLTTEFLMKWMVI
jgi:hypothetical protein